MPTFSITVVNQDFESSNRQDLPTIEAASSEAIKGALEIGMAEVVAQKPFFAAEVKLATGGEQVARFIVSIGVSRLRQ